MNPEKPIRRMNRDDFSSRQGDLPTIGWREWVSLPRLGISRVKCKVDTGARSSTLHAFDLELVSRQKIVWARFAVHPLQRNLSLVCRCEAPVKEFRSIRSSNGEVEKRPVIETAIELMGQQWTIEITLTDRKRMGFRMLLGRQAIWNRFLVDVSRSYCSSNRPEARS